VGAYGIWRCGRHVFELEPPLVMGILNVTPDSFSDGGDYLDPLAAFARGHELVDEGAVIVDVGGESTRPGSGATDVAEELARIRPVVAGLSEGDVCVSVDTRHPDVAAACVAAGASVINDVGGFRDPAMRDVAAGSDAGLVVMHMLGEPGTMQEKPTYTDVVAEVGSWLVRQAQLLEFAGVAHERIVIDPGIGFGKTSEHNLELLRRLPDLASLGYPVLVGASRKQFIGTITGETEPRSRLAGSLAVAVWAVTHGATIVRVHDAAETVRAVEVAFALQDGGE
jgi:dihydropteroate synthase